MSLGHFSKGIFRLANSTRYRTFFEVISVAHYHDKPRDRVKLAEQKAAREAEKKSAYEKYQPFKDPMPLDDIVAMIRKENDSAQQAVKVECVAENQNLVEADVSPFQKEHKKCILCQHNTKLDYKNVRLLSQFVSPFTGRIYGASVSGLCVPMQRRVAKLIRLARSTGLMPHVHKDPRYLKDPELFNVLKPRS